MTADLDIEQLRANAASAGALLKALANPDRLLLLCQLSLGERNVAVRAPTLVLVAVVTASEAATVVEVPSADPDRRAVNMDMFPSDLIDAIVTERGVVEQPTTGKMRALFGDRGDRLVGGAPGRLGLRRSRCGRRGSGRPGCG